jgi:tetratricopeptide (TPR) repeat protein
VLINHINAYVFYYAHQYDRTIEQCLKTLELDPNFAITHSVIGSAYLEKGMYEEAIAAIQKTGNESYLGYAYALAGKRDEALAILEKMKERWDRGDIFAHSIARVCVGLGEDDLALEWLEKAYERREPRLVQLKVDPRFDPLRSHPRFKALLKKMNLE